jgi:DNA sulfur modification protein DndD
MFVTLLGWESKGLRCPDMVVSFEKKSQIEQINLVQMPNGTGKSTIIELINAALVNQKFTYEQVRDLKGNDNNEGDGYFILHLGVQDEKDSLINKITFQLKFDFAFEQVTFSTKKDTSVGLELGWMPPQSLAPFLNNRCVEVFVFKGDKAENLLKSDRNDAESSISAFFGLSAISDLISEIEKEYRDRRIAGPQTDRGQSQRIRVLEKWQLQLEVLEKELNKSKDTLKDVEAQYDAKKQHMERALHANTERAEKLKEYELQYKSSVEEVSRSSMAALKVLRNPLFISESIVNKLKLLKDNLDRMKLPGTSGEFFKELSQHDICICDRVMDEQARASILKNASSFLSDNHVVIVNGIKKDINTYATEAIKHRESNPFDSLSSANNSMTLAFQNYQRQINKIRDEGTQEEKIIIDDWNALVEKRALIKRDIELLEDEDFNISVAQASSGNSDNCRNIPTVKKVIALRQNELAEIDNTVEDLRNKEKLIRILESAKKKSLKQLSRELKESSNKKLQKILPEGTRLEIISIDKNIKIGFTDIQQSRASGGQEVSIAYSFATSILERSGAQFPLIVDHPVTALQESARREMGQTISAICHQFVGFVIDTEKIGFLPSLKNKAKSLNLTTIFRNIKGNEPYLELLPSDPSKFSKSKNAIICKDEEFFDSFRDLNEIKAP